MFEPCGKPQQTVLGDAAEGPHRHNFGLAVSVPVLSITSVSTFSNRSKASAFLIKTPD